MKKNRNVAAQHFGEMVVRELVQRCPDAAPLKVETEAGRTYLGLSDEHGFCIAICLASASAKYNVMSIYAPQNDQLVNTLYRGTPVMLAERLANELRYLWEMPIQMLR